MYCFGKGVPILEIFELCGPLSPKKGIKKCVIFKAVSRSGKFDLGCTELGNIGSIKDWMEKRVVSSMVSGSKNSGLSRFGQASC